MRVYVLVFWKLELGIGLRKTEFKGNSTQLGLLFSINLCQMVQLHSVGKSNAMLISMCHNSSIASLLNIFFFSNLPTEAFKYFYPLCLLPVEFQSKHKNMLQKCTQAVRRTLFDGKSFAFFDLFSITCFVARFSLLDIQCKHSINSMMQRHTFNYNMRAFVCFFLFSVFPFVCLSVYLFVVNNIFLWRFD